MSRNTLKILLSFAVAATIAVVTIDVPAAEDDTELAKVREAVASMFEMIDAKDVTASPVDGWYQIQKGSIVAYITADGRYLLQGDLVDLEQSVNLSEAARSEKRRLLMASLADDDTIVFSPDDVKYRVTVFTDIECTYCRRLHSQIDEYLAHGIEIRYLLYPRTGPASRSWNRSEDVWCASDRNNALTMAKLDRNFDSGSCDASVIESHFSLGRDVGLAGTPAIVLDNGTLIGGYVTPEQLAAQLERTAAP